MAHRWLRAACSEVPLRCWAGPRRAGARSTLVAGLSGSEGACMSGGVANVVLSGPLILAVPVAVAAGAVTFLSPCVLPLVPGYLSYVTGMSGTAAGPGLAPARKAATPALAGAQTAGPAVAGVAGVASVAGVAGEEPAGLAP